MVRTAQRMGDAVKAALPVSLTVIILTRDEAIHLPRALASIGQIAQRVVVVDSGSTDGTLTIARENGADVYERTWINYADQFQWALDNTGIATEWVMRHDADEWLGAELLCDIRETLPVLKRPINGISLDRRHYFMGRWIRHGGRYPLRLLRIWRNGTGAIEQRWMDEHITLQAGDIRHLKGEFVDENLRDIGYFTAKHNGYAAREAVDALVAKYSLASSNEDSLYNSTNQARRKRGAKTRLYNILPLGIGPLGYFLFRYLIQLGFLDGKAGLIYHVLQGFWYRFLVDAKRAELELGLQKCPTREAKIAALQKMTGLDVAGFLARDAEKAQDG